MIETLRDELSLKCKRIKTSQGYINDVDDDDKEDGGFNNEDEKDESALVGLQKN